MTDLAWWGHSWLLWFIGTSFSNVFQADRGGSTVQVPPFEEVYRQHFRFVWRSLRGLGVAESMVDDAVQEVFLVVHRRLGEFEGRSSLRTWIFGIVQRVAQHARRSANRNLRHGELTDLLEDQAPNALDTVAARESVARLERLLDQLDNEKRTVFVLAELEQMTAPQIAEMLSLKLNTVYSRLRLAREQFERALARDERRTT